MLCHRAGAKRGLGGPRGRPCSLSNRCLPFEVNYIMYFESKFPIVVTSNFSFIIQRLVIYAMMAMA